MQYFKQHTIKKIQSTDWKNNPYRITPVIKYCSIYVVVNNYRGNVCNLNGQWYLFGNVLFKSPKYVIWTIKFQLKLQVFKAKMPSCDNEMCAETTSQILHGTVLHWYPPAGCLRTFSLPQAHGQHHNKNNRSLSP